MAGADQTAAEQCVQILAALQSPSAHDTARKCALLVTFKRKAATRRTHRFMFYANLDYFQLTSLPEVPTRACASPRKMRPARVLVGRARVSKNPCNVAKFFSETVPYLDNEPIASKALRLGTRRWRSSTPSLRKRSRRFIDFMHTA